MQHLLQLLRHLLDMRNDNQEIAKFENINKLDALTPRNIIKYLKSAGLTTINLDDLQNVLKCKGDITKYVLLVFEAHKQSTKG